MNSESLVFFKMVQDFMTSYLPRQKGANPHTIRSYKASINKLLDYACAELGVKLQNFHFGLIKRDILEKYLDHPETDDGLFGRKP